MTAARVFTPVNRLEQILGAFPDPTAQDLERNANARVAALKGSIEAYIAEQLAVVEQITREREEIIFAESLELGAAALAICEVAAAAGLDSLGEAARGIHAMIEALVDQGVWHTDALKLHVNALQVFAADPATPPEEAARILGRLKTMRDRIGVPV